MNIINKTNLAILIQTATRFQDLWGLIIMWFTFIVWYESCLVSWTENKQINVSFSCFHFLCFIWKCQNKISGENIHSQNQQLSLARVDQLNICSAIYKWKPNELQSSLCHIVYQGYVIKSVPYTENFPTIGTKWISLPAFFATNSDPCSCRSATSLGFLQIPFPSKLSFLYFHENVLPSGPGTASVSWFDKAILSGYHRKHYSNQKIF